MKSNQKKCKTIPTIPTDNQMLLAIQRGVRPVRSRDGTQVEERMQEGGQYGKPLRHLYAAAQKTRQMLFQLLGYVFPVEMEMMNAIEQDTSMIKDLC